MKKFIKRFCYLLVFFILIKLSCNYLLGYLLENIFADGTKCIASLENPVVRFFPLQASVENVSLVYPQEKKYGGGFRADKISIAVNAGALFHKELRLENLNLEGASAYSLGPDTGLINTLAFLFPIKKKGRENLEGTPFLKWIATWKFHVTDIHIHSNPGKKAQLVLGVPDNYVFWDDVHIDFIEQNSDLTKPYDFLARSDNFYYLPAKGSIINLGETASKGEIGLGKVIFKNNYVGKSRGTESVATGNIVLGENGYYDIEFSAKAREDYIVQAFKESILKSIDPTELSTQGKIVGELRNPEVKLLLQAVFKEGGISYLKPGTEPKLLKADVSVNMDRVSIENVFLSNDSKNVVDFQTQFAYFFGAKEFLLEKLKLNSYQASKFADLLSAVFSEEANKKISKYIKPESKVTLDLKGKYNADRISLEGKAEIDNFNLLKAPVDKLKIQFLMPEENLLEANFEAITIGGKALGKFNVVEGKAINGEAKLLGLELSRISGLAKIFPTLSNRAEADLLLSGTLEEPIYDLKGSVISKKVVGKIAPDKKSNFVISGNLDKLTASADFFDKTLNLNMSYPLKAESKNNFELDLTSSSLPLGYLFSKEQLANAEGELAGGLHYQAKNSDILGGEGKIEIERLRYLKDKFEITQSDKILVLLNKGDLNFSQVKFRVQDKEVVLKGGLDLRKGWHASLVGNWQIGALLTKQDVFEYFSGDLLLELGISGELGDPQFSGPLKLSNFSFSLPFGKNILGLTAGVVDAEFDAGNLNIREIRAELNGSLLKGQGQVQNIFSAERKVNLVLNLPKVVIEPVDSLNLELSGDLRIFKDANNPFVIAGEVNVNNALYEDVISLLTIIKSITNFLTGSPNSVTIREGNRKYLEDYLLDLRLQAENGLILETNIAQAELRGDLRVSGSLARPLFTGKVEVLEGVFGLQAKEFEIISGQLLFIPGNIDPQISLLSETTITNQSSEDEQVTLSIAGTLTNPEVKLHSESGLKQEDIQALLGFGTSLDTLKNSEKLGKRYGFTELINPVSGVSFADRFSSLTNLSSIQFGTALSPLTGEFIPMVSAKKPLVDKFELNLQSELSKQQAGAVTLDYVLDSNLKFFTGLETLPEGRAKSQSSGGLTLGVNYQSSFSGYGILPPEVSNFFGLFSKGKEIGSSESEPRPSANLTNPTTMQSVEVKEEVGEE